MAFNDKEIAQIIEIFTKYNAHKQYIGARYVPIFGRVGEDSIDWDNSKPYEPLTIVLYQGNSYTSRQFVPAGIDILNNDFWANTGNYNAQVEQYRREVFSFDGRITKNTNDIAQEKLDRETAITQETAAREAAISGIQKGKTSVFNTVDEMAADANNEWVYAIVIDGSSDKYGFTKRQVTYERIKKDNPNFECESLYTLANGDKAFPCVNFDNITCDAESNLACIAPMVTNLNYEYLSGQGVFTNPFNTAGTRVGVCSSFSYMFRTGLSPQNSRYALGATATNILAPNADKNPDGIENPENYQDGYMRTHTSAYSAVVNGNAFVPNELSELKVGDILYTSDVKGANTAFLGINHCEIVVSVDLNTNTYVIWQWGGISPFLITSQGKNWNPCWTVKNFKDSKHTIKLAARYPLRSIEKPKLLYEHNMPKQYNITDVGWVTTTKAASLADAAIIPNGDGMLKITAEVEPTNAEFRLCVQSVGHPNNNNQFVGTSAYSYGGIIELFAPMAESTLMRIVAVPQAQNDMAINVKSMKVEAYNAPELFNTELAAVKEEKNIPALSGKEVEVKKTISVNNGITKLMMNLKNIDWEQVTKTTPIFSLSPTAGTYSQSELMPLPASRNFNFNYLGAGKWGIAEESIPSDTRELYVTFDFPLFFGSFLTSK